MNDSNKSNEDKKPDAQDVIEFRKMIEEVMGWLRYNVLPNLEIRQYNNAGQRLSLMSKRDILMNANIM